MRKSILQSDLLILDELGYLPIDKEGAELLFHPASDFYEERSLSVTTNLEFSPWNKSFQDSSLTSALVDRLIHNAHIFSFTGKSYRYTNALSQKKTKKLGAAKLWRNFLHYYGFFSCKIHK